MLIIVRKAAAVREVVRKKLGGMTTDRRITRRRSLKEPVVDTRKVTRQGNGCRGGKVDPSGYI